MLSIEEVERTILELEKRDTTYATCERLAWLYIVHDHLTQRIVQEKARAAEMEGSPFLAACSGAEISEILRVVNEHMEAVRVIYPKEYDAVVKRIEYTKQ
ncbi:MAG: hypothetical protein PUH70_13710 [Clostridiales bacterium]|nr:hypothetical protein [Clostridiales bacterium]MDY5515639.1 hypothetical protein [Candidatus Ventricola sp.]